MRRLERCALMMLVLATSACGGSQAPAAAEAGSLSPIASTQAPVTLCIASALASQDPASRVECLLTVLDERDLLMQIDPRASLHAKFEALTDSLGAEKVAALDAEVDRLFDPEVMQASFESKVQAGYDDAQGRALLDFYATELGTRYATAAVSGSDREDDAATPWLESHPLSDARKAQISQLMAAARVSDMMRAMLLEPAVAMIQATGGDATAEQRATLVAQAEQALLPILTGVNEAMEGQLAYMLRDFDDASLTQVIDAERAPHAQWFVGLRLESFRAVIGDSYGALGRAIAAQKPGASAAPR